MNKPSNWYSTSTSTSLLYIPQAVWSSVVESQLTVGISITNMVVTAIVCMLLSSDISVHCDDALEMGRVVDGVVSTLAVQMRWKRSGPAQRNISH